MRPSENDIEGMLRALLVSGCFTLADLTVDWDRLELYVQAEFGADWLREPSDQ